MGKIPRAGLCPFEKKFIDIIDEATDGKRDGQIGHGSRIAVASFADEHNEPYIKEQLQSMQLPVRLLIKQFVLNGFHINHINPTKAFVR